jgi:hypothetical protein
MIQTISLEIPTVRIRQRFYEILPGALSWGTLITLTVLSFWLPFWISIFVIVYDLYILTRIAYMSIHLGYSYYRLRREQKVNWLQRCHDISGNLASYSHELTQNIALARTRHSIFSSSFRELKFHQSEVQQLIKNKQTILPWNEIHHIVLFPTYDESLTVLRHSLNALNACNFPHERLHVVVGFEERIGEIARKKADKLTQEFSHSFGSFITTFHPDGLPGEARVKSANASWAVQAAEKELIQQGIPRDRILVSNFDSDTVVGSEYFAHLTYAFITHPDRYHASYQPLPVYNNNIWDAPSFSRVIAAGSTFWQMIEATRPERLVTFSSHSMPLQTLHEVGYWQKNIVSEDSRIFWQCLLHYNGRYRTYPLFTMVSMDAALADTWWQTLKNQYKQKRRWAWGIENFPFVANGFHKNRHIPFKIKFTYIYRILEGHHSWATAPIIIAGLGWLPVLFGGSDFQTTVLSYSLPRVTRTIMSIAMSGLIISTAISLVLLPKRPREYSRWRYLGMILQWVLVPFIATTLSSFPALDAETRLMLGRDLSFNVMVKSRRKH